MICGYARVSTDGQSVDAEVAEDDLPPAFMKNALVWAEGIECSCC
jgi:hypothetical protein